MAFRADGEVEAVAARGLEEQRDRRRIEIEVGVDQRHPFAVRCESAGLHGVALPEIAVVMNDAEAGVGTSGEQLFGGLVDRAVRDDDHFDFLARQAGGERPGDHADVVDDLVSSVVDRQDRREHRLDYTVRP